VMKKLLFLFLFIGNATLFANFNTNKIETAITIGNNVFDQPSCLLAHKKLYGIRTGIYNNTGLGILLGYERANDVNCQECPSSDIQRFSASVIQEINTPLQFIPYTIATLGYEKSSNEKVTPDQFFAGVGAGMKYQFSNNFNAFADLRALRKFDSETTDIITTFGLAYLFQTHYAKKENNTLEQAPIVELDIASTSNVSTDENITEVITPQILDTPIEVTAVSRPSDKKYYIQAAAYASSYPNDILKKLKNAGIPAKTKQVIRNGKKFTLVITGPYKNKSTAKRALRKVQRSVPQAFITKL